MTSQKLLRVEATKHLDELEKIIGALRKLGPCEYDGTFALDYVRDRILTLLRRTS